MTELRAIVTKALLILALTFLPAFAGEITYSVNQDNITFTVQFDRGYSGVEALKNAKLIKKQTVEGI